MVISPRLLLMDEPLSNLDAKLRIELREEIRDIQKQIDIAAIYVTHDQEEALAISDRICVMSAGRVEQIGAPEDIYGDPQTLFVARFVGSLNSFAPGAALDALLARLALPRAGVETWVVRPERLTLAAAGASVAEGTAALAGTIAKYTYLGREAQVQVTTEAGPMLVQIANPGRRAAYRPGEAVSVVMRAGDLMGFDAAGRRIAAGG
jgi:iron(III) transport system ATP-binding protein